VSVIYAQWPRQYEEDAAQTSAEIDAQVKQIKIDCRPTRLSSEPELGSWP